VICPTCRVIFSERRVVFLERPVIYLKHQKICSKGRVTRPKPRTIGPNSQLFSRKIVWNILNSLKPQFATERLKLGKAQLRFRLARNPDSDP
jgi:hypothetical protein